MINQQQQLFIKQSLLQGATKEKITNDLLLNGWTTQDIEEGFNSLNTSNINSSEVKIPETQTQKTQIQVRDSSNMGLKIIIAILALIALAVFGFIFYKGVIEKNTNKVADTHSVNQDQKGIIDQQNKEAESEKVETPVVPETTTPEQNLLTSPEDSTSAVEVKTNVTTPTKTGPINCGKDMTCFMNAVKTCSPAVVEETKKVDIFGMIQTNKMKSTLSGFDSSKKCIYSSYVMDANLSYSSEMISFLKTEFEKQEGKTLTAEQEKELSVVSPDALASVKSTIGMTTKCTFTTTYLTELLTKWAKGDYSSDDLNSGNCKLTDSTGKIMETMNL